MTTTFDQEDWRKALAELVGTFFFFFIGIGSAVIVQGSDPPQVNVLFVALAHGVALAIVVSALGHVSGAHVNPAVTIGLLVARKISPPLALLYILAQLIGGIGACLALVTILPRDAWEAASLGTPALGAPIGVGAGLLLEIILTFFLVLAVFGTAVDPRAIRVGGFGIGLTVFVDILVGGPLTGAAMNPARAFAPALFSGRWDDQWLYWVGPIVGGILAALLYATIFLPRGDEPVVKVPDLPEGTVEPPMSEPGLIKGR